LRLKIRKKLRTACLNTEFTGFGSYKKQSISKQVNSPKMCTPDFSNSKSISLLHIQQYLGLNYIYEELIASKRTLD